MKTAAQWVNENSQSGPFDTVGDTEEAEALVLAIQRDALEGLADEALKRISSTDKSGMPLPAYQPVNPSLSISIMINEVRPVLEQTGSAMVYYDDFSRAKEVNALTRLWTADQCAGWMAEQLGASYVLDQNWLILKNLPPPPVTAFNYTSTIFPS